MKKQIGYRSRCHKCGYYYYGVFRSNVDSVMHSHVEQKHGHVSYGDYTLERLTPLQWRDYMEHKEDAGWWFRLRNRSVPFDVLLERGGIPIPQVIPAPVLIRTTSRT